MLNLLVGQGIAKFDLSTVLEDTKQIIGFFRAQMLTDLFINGTITHAVFPKPLQSGIAAKSACRLAC